MWTIENRARYDRSKQRYPSDLSDEEWALVEPLIPPGKQGGGKRKVVLREVVNGLMYILSTGCQWRAVPKDLPPRSTLFDYFDLWNWDGTLGRIHAELYVRCREAMGREASPTAAIIDSQSVKSAEKGGAVQGGDKLGHGAPPWWLRGRSKIRPLARLVPLGIGRECLPWKSMPPSGALCLSRATAVVKRPVFLG